jgi:peptidoglycan L-alanyl-D-glutamate endopeptidase CwlK
MLKPDWKKLGVGALAVLGGGLLIKKLAEKEPRGLAQSQRYIDQLDPSLRSMARELLTRASNVGIDLVVTQGLRSNAEQERLFAQGRTTEGPIVTNAPPGSSWHNFGMAFDVAVLSPEGKATWPNDSALWDRIGTLGKASGLVWGGDFASIKDRPHFEYHPGVTLADARQGKKPIA